MTPKAQFSDDAKEFLGISKRNNDKNNKGNAV